MAKRSDPRTKEDEIAERTAPPGDIIYQAIYDEGEHELQRSSSALALSGLAAGLSMGFSLVSEALLRAHLPDANWTPLVSKLGYSVGFLIVILGRQQLFTKNTLTVILPLLKKKELALLGNVLRLWVLVLVANLAGAFIHAWLLAHTSLFDRSVHAALSEIASASMQPGFGTILLRGMMAGWLIALMVWLLPFAESARIWVIVILAYLVSLAGLPHVIAGNVESFYLVSSGELSWGHCLGGYLAPSLIGNILGGVALVAVGAHAEFMAAEPGKD
jgi:formate/nitrite transporter FocA (FNT family)